MQHFHDPENTLSDTSLYDSEAVRKVLARASEIEAQSSKDLLNADQVEALGKEIGLSSDAVRRALGEVNGKSQDVAVSSQTQHSLLTRNVLKSAYLPHLWHSLLWIPLSFIESRAVDTGSMSGETMIALIYYVYFPALFLLALRFGFIVKRAGVGIGGAWLATLITLAISCVSGYIGSVSHPPTVNSMLVSNFIFSLLGVLGGALGVATRHIWDSLPRNARRLQNANR